MEQENKKRGIVIDRYSIVFTLIAFAFVISILMIMKHKVKYSWIPLSLSIIPFAITAMRPGRIRRNDYEGEIYYKSEKDCGATLEPQKDIDGVYLNGKYYKTANGTDILIDKDGNVSPAGFGSRMINHLDGGGYLNEAPDDCWLIKE